MTEQEWKRTVDARLREVEVQMAVLSKTHEGIESRLKGIENSAAWILRTLIGGLLGAVIMFTVAGGFAP